GRGEAWIMTLPFAVDASDLTLRPGFLAVLEEWFRSARERRAPRRTDAGATWLFPGVGSVAIEGPTGAVPVTREGGVLAAAPSRLGTYKVTVDGKPELRVAAPAARELDFRPRAVASTATSDAMGEQRAQVDASWMVALVLLGLLTVEVGLRAFSR